MANRKSRSGPPPPRKRRAIAAASTISELPDDIICSILARIPDIKSLVGCKRVCKTWRNLILQPSFAKLHLSRRSFPLSLILYRPSDAPTNPAHFGILELSDDPASLSHRNATVKFRSDIYIPHKGQRRRVIGACNGLVCFRVDNDIVVCNPILPGRHFVLPKLPKLAQLRQSDLRFGFGFSPLSDEYKVLTCTQRWGNRFSYVTFDIFTLGRDDIWRSIGGHYEQQFPHFYVDDGFVFINGALHWLGLDRVSIFLCYFDVEKEELGILSLPCDIGSMSYLGVLDDFLYLGDIRSSSDVNLWVMEDYIQTGAWSLKWVVKLQSLRMLVQPIKFLKDGSVLVIFNNKFLGSLNPQTGVTKRITYHGVRFWTKSIAHTPSFICPPWLL
ncbi:hypothetical protein Vadar_016106 [Vaccinium darrowii]|uniref:Uncharacterized protein n=1 Tax=Vaccinium darrowii TaxID=229202 RepID=A0ACB7XRD2_9ERIC|nr:hypothetical protein Vadar_016106 [Vaccinium darrowii]